MERSERVEQEFRQEFKEIREILTEIKESIAVLKTKQGIGTWIFNSLVTITIAVVSGFFGANFSK